MRREFDTLIFRRNQTNNKISLKCFDKSTQTEPTEKPRDQPKLPDAVKPESVGKSSRRHSPEASKKSKEKKDERSSSREKHKSSSDEKSRSSSSHSHYQHSRDDRSKNYSSDRFKEKSKDWRHEKCLKDEKSRKRSRSRSPVNRNKSRDSDNEKRRRRVDDTRDKSRGSRKEPELREILLKKRISEASQEIEKLKEPTKRRRESPRKNKPKTDENRSSADVLSIKSSDSEVEIVSVEKLDVKSVEVVKPPTPEFVETFDTSIQPPSEHSMNVEAPKIAEKSATGLKTSSTNKLQVTDNRLNPPSDEATPAIEKEEIPVESVAPIFVESTVNLPVDEVSDMNFSSPSPPAPHQSPMKAAADTNVIQPSTITSNADKISPQESNIESKLPEVVEPFSSSLFVNDSLDSSGGSKENSLNYSQENGTKFKTKRGSYHKDINEEGVVVLTLSRSKGKRKKHKEKA